jgi:hypothetical protein
MFMALRDGQFDHLLEDIPIAPPRAGNANPGARPAPPPPGAGGTPALQAGGTPALQPPGPPVTVDAAGAEAPPAAPSKKVPSRPKLQIDPATLLAPPARQISPTAVTMVATARTEPAPPEQSNEVDLDLDALERAAAEAQTPFFQQIQDLPPPPAAVLGKRSSDVPSRDTSYRTVGGKKAVEPQPTAPAPAAQSPGSGRYAPSRPATIFHNARPAEGASIFGEDLISEKSLDEVILSYLAEDLDAPSEKK